MTRAAQVGVEPIALVVRDPSPYPGPRGLEAFIENWRNTGRELRLIDLAALRGHIHLTAPTAPAPPRPQGPSNRRVRAMLFGDVAGFSGLPESHLPAFFIQFLAVVEQQLAATPALFQNTWGDGLYLVFKDVAACADFAMSLLRRLERFDFAAFGFSSSAFCRSSGTVALLCGS